MNSKKAIGWFVRVTWCGETVRKFFGDNTNGGRRRALKEAIRFRNETERELYKPRTERAVVGLTPKNKTGVVGVTRVTKKAGVRSRKKEPYYQVAYPTKEIGKLGRSFVSIKQHGQREALRRAKELRQRKEREVYGAVIRRNKKG